MSVLDDNHCSKHALLQHWFVMQPDGSTASDLKPAQEHAHSPAVSCTSLTQLVADWVAATIHCTERWVCPRPFIAQSAGSVPGKYRHFCKHWGGPEVPSTFLL